MNNWKLPHDGYESCSGVDLCLFLQHGIGFTDVVKRPTAGGGDLRAADYREWAPVLRARLLEFAPDIAWFHGIGDRVGLYVGIEWMGSTYEPLAEVSPQLEKDERFHANAGIAYVREIIKTEDGRREALDGLHKWWPAVLDMFGKSDSKNSEVYVKWGIKAKSNEELRQQYIDDTVPVLEGLELDVPDHLANRRFL